MMACKKIAIICPCFNEFDYVDDFILALSSQTIFDDATYAVKVYFVDGLSDDGTFEKLLDFSKSNANIEVIKNIDRYVSCGLNIAISSLESENINLLVRMDFHSIYPPTYISYLVKQFYEIKAKDPCVVNVGVGLVTCPPDESLKSHIISKVVSSKYGVGSSDFRVSSLDSSPIKVDTVPFGCFDFSVFKRVGKFDTELLRNQDDEFNLRIVNDGGSIYLLPGLRVKYFARSNLHDLFRMFYQYGFFKPLVNYKRNSFASLRQFMPLSFVSSLLLFCLFIYVSVIPLLSLVTLYLIFIGAFVSGQEDEKFDSNPFLYSYYSGMTIFSVHFSYGFGYLVGLFSIVLGKRNVKFTVTR